jgi:hypothetical protein
MCIYIYIYGRNSNSVIQNEHAPSKLENGFLLLLLCPHLERHDPPLHHRCKDLNGPTRNFRYSGIREKEELRQTHFGLQQLQAVHVRVVFEHKRSQRGAGTACHSWVLRAAAQDHKPLEGRGRRLVGVSEKMALRTGQRNLALGDVKFCSVTCHQLRQDERRPGADVLRHDLVMGGGGGGGGGGVAVRRQERTDTLHNLRGGVRLLLCQLLSNAFVVTQ